MPLVAQTPLTAGGGFEPDGDRQRLWACPCQAGTWGTHFWRSVGLLLALFRLSSRTGESRTDGPCGLSAAPGPRCDERRRGLDLWQAPPALRLPLAASCAAGCSRRCGKQVRQACPEAPLTLNAFWRRTSPLNNGAAPLFNIILRWVH